MRTKKYPNHNRKRTRLKDFNYSDDGAYFVTICAYNRENIFGEIRDNKIILNQLGKIVTKCWREITDHFPHTRIDEFIVMPNHVHGIVWIDNWNIKSVGNADLRSLQKPDRSKMLIPKIIHGFKSSVTRKIHRQNSDIYSIWQRSFYDHVIRNDEELNSIRDYIALNPEHWKKDKNNLDKKG